MKMRSTSRHGRGWRRVIDRDGLDLAVRFRQPLEERLRSLRVNVERTSGEPFGSPLVTKSLLARKRRGEQLRVPPSPGPYSTTVIVG
jgi:hypothetical protein